MKKTISILLCVVLLFTTIGNVMAAETNETGAVYSDAAYDGFDLSWTNNGERDVLLSATNENSTISFQYDERDLRTSKTNAAGETTYFTYDASNNLTVVQFRTHRLEYIYNAVNQLTAITIDGVTYACELSDMSVYRLVDQNGNTVVEYQYEDGFVTAVYGRNEEGEFVDKTNDSEFVGNLNHVTYNSYYYDEETGWYYCGRYYDAAGGRFVDGLSAAKRELLLQRMENARMGETSILERAQTLYNIYINDPEFGAPIDADVESGNWYDGLRTQEILARLIYGENPFQGVPQAEQVAIAWVLWNRKMAGNYGGYTLRGVATEPEQFSAICNASDNSLSPRTDLTEWKTAVLYACYLICAETTTLDNLTAALAAVMPRPYGITSNHTCFRSFDRAKELLQDGETLRLAVIAGYSLIGSTAESLESIYLAYDEEFYETEGTHIFRYDKYGERLECVNIFFCD